VYKICATGFKQIIENTNGGKIMKKLRKMLALVLTLLMVLPMNALAASATKAGTTPVELTEIDGVRTAISSDGKSEYTVVVNKNDNTISMSVRNLVTDEIESASMDLSNDISLTGIISPRAVTIQKDTYSGYKYIQNTGTRNEWRLERPKL
jgi:hypothetical protein